MTAPATGVNTANVQITGDVSGLTSAMSTAAQSVQVTFTKISESVSLAGQKVTQSTEKMAVSAEGLSRRFEHVAVAMAFAVTALANDSERGLTRAAHAVALLGFAFGPIVGAATTAGAIIIEQFVSAAHKAEEQAKATADRVAEMYRSIGEGGSGEKAAKRAQQLFSGDQFTPDSDPFAKLVRAGGIQALERSLAPLQKELDDTNAKIKALGEPGGATFDIDAFATLQQAAAKYNAELAPLNAQLQELKAVHADVLKLATEFLAKGAQEDLTAGEAAEKKEIQEKYREQLKVLEDAAAETQRAFTEWQKAHPTDTSFWVDREAAKKKEEQRQRDEETFYRQLNAEEHAIREASERTFRELQERQAVWASYFSSTFGTAFSRFIETGENLHAVWRDLWYSIVQTTAQAYAQMGIAAAAHALAIRKITLTSALETVAVKVWEATRWIAIEAAKAAAAAYSAIAGIPFIGPVLAVGAAAAAFAGVMSLASHLGGGGGGGSSHGGAAVSRSAAPGGNTYVIQAMDAKSFKTFALENSDTFVHVITKTAKDGSLTPKKMGLA